MKTMSKINSKWGRRGLAMFAVLIVAGLIKYFFFPATTENNYITAPVTRMDLEETVLATGIVNAYKQVSVGAQASGQIKSLNVKLGQKVSKGDVVALIDPSTQKNTLQTAEATLASNQAQLASKQAALTKAQLDFTRQQTMLKEGATARENYDAAKATLDSAKADITQATAQIKQSKISVDTAKLNLGYTQVLAPIDGVVVSLAVEEGQTVNANQSTPTILVLAQLDKVTIRAEISEGDVTRVKEGMPVYFTILGDTAQRYNTTLRSIDPGPTALTNDSTTTISSSTSTAIYYYGMMDVPNEDQKLRIAMTTEVSIVLNEAKQALSIPSTALGKRNDKGQYRVQVMDKDKKPVERWVEVGLNNNVNAEIKSGLNEGEQVIVSQKTSASSDSNSSSTRVRMPRGL